MIEWSLDVSKYRTLIVCYSSEGEFNAYGDDVNVLNGIALFTSLILSKAMKRFTHRRLHWDLNRCSGKVFAPVKVDSWKGRQ